MPRDGIGKDDRFSQRAIIGSTGAVSGVIGFCDDESFACDQWRRKTGRVEGERQAHRRRASGSGSYRRREFAVIKTRQRFMANARDSDFDGYKHVVVFISIAGWCGIGVE